MTGTSQESIIATIRDRHNAWFGFFRWWRLAFWACGVLGAGASTVAAAENVSGAAAPYFAALSSLCFAIIGFANPQRRANAYVSAWRTLGTALLLYEAGKYDISQVIAAVDRGEAAIGEADAALQATASHT